MKLQLGTRYALLMIAMVSVSIVFLVTMMLIEFRNSYTELAAENQRIRSSDLRQALEKRAVNQVQILAHDLVQPLTGRHYTRLALLAGFVARQNDIDEVLVFDRNFRVIYHSGNSSAEVNKTLSALNIDKSLYVQGVLHKLYTDSQLKISAPIFSQKQQVGGIILSVPLQQVNQHSQVLTDDVQGVAAAIREHNIRIGVIAALVTILFGIFIALLVTTKISWPFAKLINLVRKIGRNDYDATQLAQRDDEFGELVAAFNDVSDNLRNTTGSLGYLEKVINTMTDAMFVINDEGLIELVNDAMCGMLHYEKEKLTGAHYSMLFDENAMPQINMLRGALLKKGKVTNYDISMFARFGAEIPVSLSAAIMSDEQMVNRKFIYVAQDITERIQFQARLQRAKEKAEAANNAKTEFLANMSHEIRTPLTAIIGFSETLLDKGQDSKERDRSVNTIIRSARHLLQVINDILDLSKVEVDKLEIECLDIDLFNLMTELRMLSGLLAEENGLYFKIHYQLPLPRVIVSDPVRLKQILLNLCGNAIKFTEKGGIDIFVRADIHNMTLYIDVADTGIGMTEAQIKNIFSAFRQGDTSTTRKYGGTGLGLYLSKQLAELLGGTIKVESRPGEGSKFSVSIDIGELDLGNIVKTEKDIPQQDESLLHHDFSEVEVRNRAVLLAEDNLDNQLLISMYLRRMGLEVEVAENGLQAVEKAQQKNYDLILMDMQMPIMNGMDATKSLRSMGYINPIVALTANAMKEDVEKFYTAGCNNFIAKPINRQLFFEVVAGYFRDENKSPAVNEASALTENPVPAVADTMPEVIRSSLLDEDPELIDLVRVFIDRLPGIVDTIIELHRQGNYAELKVKIHDLKSVGGNYGYNQISEVARAMDKQLVAGQHSDLSGYIQQLCQLRQAVLLGAKELA